MIHKSTNNVKGFVFAGCSFTWGQGLYYYSNIPTLKEPPPDSYDKNLVTDAQIRYAATLRFPRLVANYFNTFEVVSKQNGGSEETSFLLLKKAFNLVEGNTHLLDDSFRYNEIEYIIFQTSQINRNSYMYEYKGKIQKYLYWEEPLKKVFLEYLNDKKIEYEDWEKNHYTKMYNQLKTEIDFYEKKGIKVLILSWENDYYNLFGKEDNWFMDRFIPIVYENTNYISIRELMNNHVHLHIKYDYENFIDPPKDHHPSKLCHEIIAKNIIDRIESDKLK